MLAWYFRHSYKMNRMRLFGKMQYSLHEYPYLHNLDEAYYKADNDGYADLYYRVNLWMIKHLNPERYEEQKQYNNPKRLL